MISATAALAPHTTRARGARSSRWPAPRPRLPSCSSSRLAVGAGAAGQPRTQDAYALPADLADGDRHRLGVRRHAGPARVPRWRRRSSPYRRDARRTRSGRSCEWIGGSYPRSPPIWSAGGWAWGQPGCSASGRGSAWPSGTAAGCTCWRSRCCLVSPWKPRPPGPWSWRPVRTLATRTSCPGPEDAAEPPRAGQLAAGEDGSRPVPGQTPDEPACISRTAGTDCR
jgi:hypothetical protein